MHTEGLKNLLAPFDAGCCYLVLHTFRRASASAFQRFVVDDSTERQTEHATLVRYVADAVDKMTPRFVFGLRAGPFPVDLVCYEELG